MYVAKVLAMAPTSYLEAPCVSSNFVYEQLFTL